jgi:two-component system, sensor histidine kinase and response regulator
MRIKGNGNMCKILVIEDDPIVRANTVDLLREEGYEVVEAENGRIGIDKAKESIPDLIISDIMMPEADGYTVYRELQNNILTSSIPFIFLTAKTEIRDIKHGMDIGADDYLTKPFRSSDLLNAINVCLDKNKKANKKDNFLTTHLPHEITAKNKSILDFSELIKDNPVELNNEEIRHMMTNIYPAEKKLYKHNKKFAYLCELEKFLSDKKCITSFRNCCTNSVGKVIYNAIIKTAEKFERRNDLMVDVQDGRILMFQKHLEIAVSEIMENACKFSKKGTPISIYSSVEDNKYILTFIDNGKGIKTEQMKDSGVIKDFNNGDFDQPGTGFGLDIVDRVTVLYDGVMCISSIYGSITKVVLEFKNFHI